MLIRPFYAFFFLERPFLLFGAPRPFYAYQSFLCLSVRTVNFMLVRLFMLISGRVAPFHAYHCGKKLKSIDHKMTLFSRAVCPV